MPQLNQKISALITLILSGGENISDIRQLENDQGFKAIMDLEHFPVKSVISDMLNRMNYADTRKYYFINIKAAVELSQYSA